METVRHKVPPAFDNHNDLAVQLADVSVFYGSVCALERVTLLVPEGESLAVIGPNGGGKTTLLKVIAGLTAPSRGTVSVFGLPPAESQRWVGYVPQLAAFNRGFPVTVEEAVLMGRLNGREPWFFRPSATEREQLEPLLTWLGLSDLRKRRMSELSAGQAQKALLARALAAEPHLLLLDEPTASVDPAARTEIYERIEELMQRITVIMVTHDLMAIPACFSSIACLNRELVYHGRSGIDEGVLARLYGCPVELIAHGVPHRVLKEH